MRRVYTDAPLLVVDIEDSDSSSTSTSGSGRQTPELGERKHHRPPKPEKPEVGAGGGGGGRAAAGKCSCLRALCSIFCMGQKSKMVLRQLRKLLEPKNLFVLNFTVLLINLFFLVMQMKQGFWPVETYFQPVLSAHDKQVMMTTMKKCFSALTAANITVFMYGGTLIGSYRHHGFIPWDDDVDIIVNGSDKERVVEVLERLEPNYKLYYGGDPSASSPWKFYSDEIHSKFIHKPFKWPYVDMFFFWENSTHIFDEHSREYSFSKSKVFPLVQRPFMDARFPAPCDTKSVLDTNYVIELCRSRSFSHMMEVPMFTFSTQDVPCERLTNYFPFVHRINAAGSVNETLRMSDWTLSSVVLPECQTLRSHERV